MEGLRAVPAEVKDAALAMGYTPRRRLFAVELPLALPAIVAGLRVATVSTVSLVSVGGAVGLGGLGFMFFHGYRRDLQTEIWAGIIASVRAGRGARPRDRARSVASSRRGPASGRPDEHRSATPGTG